MSRYQLNRAVYDGIRAGEINGDAGRAGFDVSRYEPLAVGEVDQVLDTPIAPWITGMGVAQWDTGNRVNTPRTQSLP